MNSAIKVPGPRQSNQIGEIVAIIQAIDAIPLFRPLTIVSDSKYAIEGLTEHLSTWEDIGWIGIKSTEFFKRAAYLLKRRTATTHFKWVKGHNGDQGNEECDQLAKIGADKPLQDQLNLDIPVTFDLQGAKLTALTQATAYRGIMERQTPQKRATTTTNLQLTREALHNYNNVLETDETIWSNMRQRTLRIRVKQFLYKAMHGTQKLGKYWQWIERCEVREFCTTCGSTESMEHILASCPATARNLIWALTKDLWPHTQHPWPDISLGIILGCGSLTLPHEEQHQDNLDEREIRNQRANKNGAKRLLQILISEASHLIWVLRCERVVRDPPRIHTISEIETRWLQTINKRLTDDKIIATRIKRDEQSLRKVKETWEPVLRRFSDLPHNWVYKREVLVGIRTRHLAPEGDVN
jgi:ribonuclease HI